MQKVRIKIHIKTSLISKYNLVVGGIFFFTFEIIHPHLLLHQFLLKLTKVLSLVMKHHLEGTPFSLYNASFLAML